ncbi:hypothetical protein [Endozoicomonas sp. SCSIO W0465]|uniref:hypothetical protein n=1 Tax=Endozoicomonas sp. SCSIO W0465 TaxID=2918516 RepID=UPI002076026F|nr:hypothetical protein [Endozoicomonas sp. SCSIO W0465]USE39203.1 hypothetical protein MJO57_14220 [Endozoicomonas sp. SCSIO W0465]
MDPLSSSHTPARHSFGDGEKCSDAHPARVTPTILVGEKAITDVGASKDGNGKSIDDRDACVIVASDPSHGVSTHALLKSNQGDSVQVSLCEDALQGIKLEDTEQREQETVLNQDVSVRKLGEIKKQIIDLTGIHGDVPHKELTRFKLAALYIQENILSRMLYGMSSEEEAFDKVFSLGDLIPRSSNGGALIKVLDLWWLPDNDKYFSESSVDYLKKLRSAREHLKEADKLLKKVGEIFDMNQSFVESVGELKKIVNALEENRDNSSSSAAVSESFCEKEYKNIQDRIISISEKLGNEFYNDIEGDQYPIESQSVVKNITTKGQQSGETIRGVGSDFILTKLDKIVIVFHHLYQEFSNDSSCGLINLVNINIFDDYFNELLSETELSVYEKEIAYFACLQTLAHLYSRLVMECTVLRLGYSGLKSNGTRLVSLEKARDYGTIMQKMVVASINSGICRVADFWVLRLLASGFVMNFRWKTNYRDQLATLYSALEKSPKQESEIALAKSTCFIIAETLEDVGAFKSVADNSAKYNTFALLIMVWNDLGLSHWPYSTTLNPEKALEYLEFIHYEISDLNNPCAGMVKKSMDKAYDFYIVMCGSTPAAQLCSERMALYYFMMGDPTRASALLEFTKHKNKELYFGLSMASKGKYQLAIQFLEKNNIKDVCIKALLGILYEKLASVQGESSEQFMELIHKAELSYRTVIGSRPEMNKHYAMLLEKRGDLSGSLKQWEAYQRFLLKQESESNIRSLRFKIPMELKLVGEKISELENQLKDIKSDADTQFYTKGVVENKPERRPVRKSKGMKKSPHAADRRVTCQETFSKIKSADVYAEKHFSIQVQDLKSERNINNNSNSGSEFDEKANNQEPNLIETPWQLATGKSGPVWLTVDQGVRIPVGFSIKEVERHWEYTRAFRNDLTNRLLLLDIGREDYDGILAIINQYVAKIANPVAKLHFIQNREWLLRCKSFDNYALYAQCHRSGQSIQALKAELRLSILQCVREQVESIFQYAFQCSPSSLWFSNPGLLKKDIQYLIDHVHPEFRVQLGAQFSTAAHVMKDIHWEFTSQREKDQTCRALYGYSPDDYCNLADKFYDFRSFIDPHHVSDII